MSLNKNFQNLNLKSVSKNRDSFDDRFCDDLCENILQYLPLEHKIRLECVSKQFQRTIFQRQNEIILQLRYRESFWWEYSYKPNVLRLKYPTQYRVDIEMDLQLEVIAFKSCYHKPIESLLKKCPNIQSIDLNRFHENNNQISKLLLQLINKYCNHLIEFNGISLNTNECESQEFCLKFGSKLKELGCFDYLWDSSHDLLPFVKEVNLFPNLQSLKLETHRFHLDQILRIDFKSLKRLAIDCRESKEYMVRELLKKFHKISHLRFDFKEVSYEKSFFNAFKDLPLLLDLIELKISTDYRKKSDFIIDCLKLMAKKSPNLKRIQFIYCIILENISDFEQLMSSLKAFPQLKRLDISLEFMCGFEFDQIFLSKGFPQQLTHLRIYFEFDIGFPSNKPFKFNFKDIDIYLPKLQYLIIKNRFGIEEEWVKQIVQNVSRLSRLVTIHIGIDRPKYYPIFHDKFIENCPKIRTIHF